MPAQNAKCSLFRHDSAKDDARLRRYVLRRVSYCTISPNYPLPPSHTHYHHLNTHSDHLNTLYHRLILFTIVLSVFFITILWDNPLIYRITSPANSNQSSYRDQSHQTRSSIPIPYHKRARRPPTATITIRPCTKNEQQCNNAGPFFPPSLSSSNSTITISPEPCRRRRKTYPASPLIMFSTRNSMSQTTG